MTAPPKRFTVRLRNQYTGRSEKHVCYEGDRCDLFFPSAYTYRWHPALWLQEFVLGNPIFCHIPEHEIAKAFAGVSCVEPPRIAESGGYQCRILMCEHGLFCRKCQQPRFHYEDEERYPPSPDEWHWRDLGICESCAAETKLDSSHRQQQLVLRETVFRNQRRRWLDKRDRTRAAKRETNAKEQKERRILERASYELLNELGLIDELRRQQNAQSRNYRSETPVVGKTQSSRRTARRDFGKPESLRS